MPYCTGKNIEIAFGYKRMYPAGEKIQEKLLLCMKSIKISSYQSSI